MLYWDIFKSFDLELMMLFFRKSCFWSDFYNLSIRDLLWSPARKINQSFSWDIFQAGVLRHISNPAITKIRSETWFSVKPHLYLISRSFIFFSSSTWAQYWGLFREVDFISIFHSFTFQTINFEHFPTKIIQKRLKSKKKVLLLTSMVKAV